jgi:phenylpropionate dioxygenase-like ring-hydroxylating dioxygenase large terminal subunit
MSEGVRVSPIPLSEFESSVVDARRAVGLPPATYTDSAFHEFELDAVFSSEWLCVGRVDQIPNPGDYVTATLVGREPVIVVRADEGTIHVMSAVCQHRGMCITAPPERPKHEWFAPLDESSGHTRNFRCPYHWWIYGLDGSLLGAPSMEQTEGFSRSDYRLPQLKVEIWQGFIFANFDPAASSLSAGTGKLDRVLENYGVAEMMTTKPEQVTNAPFNWKIMVENFMESYHNYGLHNRLLEVNQYGRGAAASTGYHPPYEAGDNVIVGYGVSPQFDTAVNPTQHALFPPIPSLTAEERRHSVFAYVPPTLLLGVFPDSGFWFTVNPTGPTTHTLTMAYLFPRATTELKLYPALLDLFEKGIEQFNNQDLPADAAIQRGMHSRFAPRGPLSYLDLFLPKFNAWLLERYKSREGQVPAVAVADGGREKAP